MPRRARQTTLPFKGNESGAAPLVSTTASARRLDVSGSRARLAAIAARENVELHPTRLQQFTQQKNKRRFARSANRQVAHADDWPAQLPRVQNTAVIEHVTRSYARAVNISQEMHSALALVDPSIGPAPCPRPLLRWRRSGKAISRSWSINGLAAKRRRLGHR